MPEAHSVGKSYQLEQKSYKYPSTPRFTREKGMYVTNKLCALTKVRLLRDRPAAVRPSQYTLNLDAAAQALRERWRSLRHHISNILKNANVALN